MKDKIHAELDFLFLIEYYLDNILNRFGAKQGV
jgi:hypothetical protein